MCQNDRSKHTGISVPSQQFHEERYQSYDGNCTEGQHRHQCFGFLSITRTRCTDVLSVGILDQAKYDTPITPTPGGVHHISYAFKTLFRIENEIRYRHVLAAW